MIEQITETTLLETKDNQNSNFKNFIDVGHFFSNHNEKIVSKKEKRDLLELNFSY